MTRQPQAPTDHVKEAIYGGAEFVCVTCPRNIYGAQVAWEHAHPAQTEPTDELIAKLTRAHRMSSNDPDNLSGTLWGQAAAALKAAFTAGQEEQS